MKDVQAKRFYPIQLSKARFEFNVADVPRMDGRSIDASNTDEAK
jgi:hypothetical protein